MTRSVCPREAVSLAASRRGALDPSIAAHVASCPDCGPAVALDRALALVASEDVTRPFPSPAALRLEADLLLEERRLARRAAVGVSLQALALAVCLALFAAVWALDLRPGAPGILGAGSICAAAVVALSMWKLVRAVDEAAALS